MEKEQKEILLKNFVHFQTTKNSHQSYSEYKMNYHHIVKMSNLEIPEYLNLIAKLKTFFYEITF